MFLESATPANFFIEATKTYNDLPFEQLDRLTFSVYVVDYTWQYLFLNENTKKIFGDVSGDLIGKSALDVFKGPQYHDIFEKIQNALEQRSTCNAIVYSPLRGKQVQIKGYPLEDCYLFCIAVLPSKDELLEELRAQLKR